MIHDDCAGLVINLCIDFGVSDQVDNPLLAFRIRQTQSSGEIPASTLEEFWNCKRVNLLDVNSLMYLAVRLRDQMPS
jgi:hypothetical protein